MYKKQYYVYDFRTRQIKLAQKKLARWNILLEVKESEYEKDIIIYQVGNKRDWVIVSIY